MPRCIFCNNELTVNTKPEHILPSALGGRMTTRMAICSDHNNDFGGTIDQALAKQVAVIRNMLQLESGTKNPPPALPRIMAGSQKVSFGSDGRPKLESPPFIIKELGDGKYDVQIMVESEEELHRILPHLAAKLKIPVEQLKQQMLAGTAAFVEKRPDTVHHDLSFGSEDTLRSIAKSCLVLLATKVGSDALKTDPFAEVRNFVLSGSSEFYKNRVRLDARALPCTGELEQKFGDFFNLIYVRSDANGRVIGHFTLYNAMSWQIVLAETDGPQDAKIALVSNPLNPGTWDGKLAETQDLEFSWLNEPDGSDKLDHAHERLSAILKRHVDQARETEIGRIVKSVCEKHGIMGDDDPIGNDKQATIWSEVIARTGALAANVPYEDKLTPARLKDLLRLHDEKLGEGGS